MQRRHGLSNIPIELVRTFVTIVKTRSYSAAGRELQLSQPAISAHVRRLQTVFGGTLFRTGPQGVEITPFGVNIIELAKAVLEANDRLIDATRGTSPHVRLGIGSLYAGDYYDATRQLGRVPKISVRVGHSDELDRLFLDGQLDVVCSLQPSDMAHVVLVWEERITWVRSVDFEPRAGAPIPIVSLQGARPDVPIADALKKRDLSFEIVIASADFASRMDAVASGLGLTAIPKRYIKPPLVEATESYLPPIEPIIGAVRVRSPNVPGIGDIVDRLRWNKPNARPVP